MYKEHKGWRLEAELGTTETARLAESGAHVDMGRNSEILFTNKQTNKHVFLKWGISSCTNTRIYPSRTFSAHDYPDMPLFHIWFLPTAPWTQMTPALLPFLRSLYQVCTNRVHPHRGQTGSEWYRIIPRDLIASKLSKQELRRCDCMYGSCRSGVGRGRGASTCTVIVQTS